MFEDLEIIHRYLNTNAVIVSSYKEGGQHLSLIMTNDKYFALATDAFPAPGNPGATPTIVNNATAAQITEANQAHTEATHIY
jgi:hypothetical protein